MATDLPAASSGENASSGDVSFGHFVVPRREDGLLWELGRGNMGVTYRAFDTSLQTEVALKVIRTDRVADENVRRRFRREARAAAKIRHPNIASVLYLGEQGGEFFYTMEFVAGRSLEALLKETNGPLPVIQAVALAAQGAAALNAAHKREVVHRDLKPANLMLLENDALDHEDERTDAAGKRLLKVIDFGLARSFGGDRPEDSLVTQTVTGFVGTPAYASPEQGNEQHDIDGRSDLYSLGVILWQMLAGRLPFTGRVMEVLGKHQVQPPPLEQLAGLPPPVVELVSGLLIKSPAERQPQTAGELRTALDRILQMLGTGSSGSVAPSRSGPDEISSSSDTTNAPGIGATLATRYLLNREVGVGDGGKLFQAIDLKDSKKQVALKLLPVGRLSSEPGLTDQMSAVLDRLRQGHNALFLSHDPAGLQHLDETVFYAREWAQGISFDELLRVRQGGMGVAEVFRLLDALPAALDAASASGQSWISLAPHKLFVVPSVPTATVQELLAQCKQPVEQWPPFAVRLNPVDFPPLTAPSTGQLVPLPTSPGLPPAFAVAPAAALARLIRSLLGKASDAHGPVVGLSDKANAVLIRALEPAGFPGCRVFWNALRTTTLMTLPVPHASGQRPPGKLVTQDLPPRLDNQPRVSGNQLQISSGRRIAPGILATSIAGIFLLGALIFWTARSHKQRASLPAVDTARAGAKSSSPPQVATAPTTSVPAPRIVPEAATPSIVKDSTTTTSASEETAHPAAPLPAIGLQSPTPRKASPRTPGTHVWNHPNGYVSIDFPERFGAVHPPVNPGNVIVLAAYEPGTEIEIDVIQVNNTTDANLAWRYIVEACNKMDMHIRVESTRAGENGLTCYEGTTFNFGNYRWIGVSKAVPNGVVFVTASSPTGLWQSRAKTVSALLNNNVHFP